MDNGVNSYIIDLFLSFILLLWLVFGYFSIKDQLRDLSQRIDRQVMAVAIDAFYYQSFIITVLPVSVMFFLLWRFYALMINSHTWGYGGFGLITILAIYSIFINFLHVLLFLIRYSKYVQAKPSKATIQQDFKQMLASNAPMSKPAFADNLNYGDNHYRGSV